MTDPHSCPASDHPARDPSPSILIVEDDAPTACAIAAEVAALGCRAVLCDTFDAGLNEAATGRHSVIVLDRMLPGGDGVDAIARIRAGAGGGAAILMLSALGRAANRVEGLEKGADDYLAKPYAPEELRARLRALLRRAGTQSESHDLIAFGDMEIRLKARTVHVGRVHVAVSPREFDLIVHFARHEGQVVTRRQLLEQVWNLHFDPGTNVVDVHVGRLRRKLEEAAGRPLIQTARGEGYVFTPLSRNAT
ncbi:response regulator transcription factor [Szabonella alba]|uniref:Response regulator transcription factor n=1 Tax=Szabonella alba TaxID=2804194 RepID=A0A8K0VAC7_9RHOB|nr:response regulator transcription factor [Szabonella alba]MBL4916169.1 response regulator transcription factor [Szabonella alba]